MKLKYCNVPHPTAHEHPRATNNGCCYLEPGHEGEHQITRQFGQWSNYWTGSLKQAIEARHKYRANVKKIKIEMVETLKGRSIVMVRLVWGRLQYWLIGLEHIHAEVENHRERKLQGMHEDAAGADI